MLTASRTKPDRVYDVRVDDGMVWCRRMGQDVGIDQCRACVNVEDVTFEDGVEIVHCQRPPIWLEALAYAATYAVPY